MQIKEAFRRVLHRHKEVGPRFHPLVKDIGTATKNLQSLLKLHAGHEEMFNGLERISNVFEQLGEATGGYLPYFGGGAVRVNGFDDEGRTELRLSTHREANAHFVIHATRTPTGRLSLDDIHTFIVDKKEIYIADRKGTHPGNTIIAAEILKEWGRVIHESGQEVSEGIAIRLVHAAA